MIRVLIISARADWGGGPEHIYSLIRKFSRSIEPYIACPDDYPYWNRYKELLGTKKLTVIPHRKFRISCLLNLKKIVKKNKIHIIHSHGKGAGLYARLLALITNIPCVHTFHGIHIQEYSLIIRKSYLSIERLMSRLTKQLISVSDSEAKLINDLNICSAKKLNIIPNGVIIQNTYNTGPGNFDNQKHSIVHITRFDYPKNFDLIFDIFESLKNKEVFKNIIFVVLGDGPQRKAYQSKVLKYDWAEKVQFLGAVENPQDYLEQATCLISTSRWEGLPLAIIEAMATGVPVVASNIVGNSSLVENFVTGYLYDIENPEQASD